MIDVLFVNATEEMQSEVDTKSKLKILEGKINDKLYFLQKGITNAFGEKFSVEIMDIKIISPSIAMITSNTRKE